jgi:hypothetical protein
VGAVDDHGGQDPGLGGPRAAEAKRRGGVKGGGGGGVPDRGHEGAGRLRVVL